MNKAFDKEKYLELQSKKIIDRVHQFDNKLYLEFGGKLFDDYHASRVLPGFDPDTKLKMLLTIKDKVEVVIVINSNDIETNKVRSDIGINYESDVLRLIDAFRESELYVGSVVITQFEPKKSVLQFKTKLENLGIKTYLHYKIDSYPYNVSMVLSEEGFGKNEYIETTKEIVVMTAPGPGSGKMATCLSQLYHENKRGIKAGYAKYETFPVWDLPIKHPVNLAYEAATADLNDIIMIDPYHLDAYNEIAVNYNRDVEVYPILESIFEQIYGESPYKSPTDMGVNMIGSAIINIDAAKGASKREIVRRYLNSICEWKNGKISIDACDKIALIMKQLEVSVDDRKCVKRALDKEVESNTPSMALELPDKRIITAKTTSLLTAPAALILNAIKALANIDDNLILLSPNIIEPIVKLKLQKLGNHNPKLHADEILVALAISAQTNPIAEMAFEKLQDLAGSEAHSTVLLPNVDENVFKKLKINLTTEPNFKAKSLYRK